MQADTKVEFKHMESACLFNDIEQEIGWENVWFIFEGHCQLVKE